MINYKRYFILILSFLLFTGAYSLIDVSNKLSKEALEALKNDSIEALSLSKQSLVADPSNAFAWAVFGKILMKTGKAQESINYFERSLSINPFLKEGLYWAAESDIALKDINSAEKKLNILINSCSNCGESEILKQLIESFKKQELKANDTKEESKLND